MHFEDQLAAEKKCGHMGGKVLVPTSHFIRTLNAARLAADVLDVPTLLIARTDALSATLTSDTTSATRRFVGERTSEGAIGSWRADAAIREPRLCPARPPLVRDFDAQPSRSTPIREAITSLPRNLSLQLLAVVPWSATDADATARFQTPGRARLRVPVHHACRVAPGQPRDVRPGAPVREGDERTSSCRSASSRRGAYYPRGSSKAGTRYFDLVLTTLSGGNQRRRHWRRKPNSSTTMPTLPPITHHPKRARGGR